MSERYDSPTVMLPASAAMRQCAAYVYTFTFKPAIVYGLWIVTRVNTSSGILCVLR